MKNILILHGPNLNLLGKREPEIYGELTLDEVNQKLIAIGRDQGVDIRAVQANGEGALIDALQSAALWADGVVFNPAGYTHTSVALRDAITAIQIPVVEVHISNIFSREEFRHKSLIAPVCIGSISGFGWRSYVFGIQALISMA
jgi:3-dehydroquinate dehydratase-2